MTLRRKKELRRFQGKRQDAAKGLRRKRWVKARNAERRAKEFARCYGSKERVEWVNSLPCCCGCGRSPSDNAHTIGGGASRKADAETIAPLFRECHRAYDQYRAPFDTERAREAVQFAARVTAVRWNAQSGLTPLSAIVPGVHAKMLEGGE